MLLDFRKTFSDVEQHPACTDDAILYGKPFGIPLMIPQAILKSKILKVEK
jgi:hypothetical protein